MKCFFGGLEDILLGGVVEFGELFGGQYGIEVGDDLVYGFCEGVYMFILYWIIDIRVLKQICLGCFLQYFGMYFGGCVVDGQSVSSMIFIMMMSEVLICQLGCDFWRMIILNRLISMMFIFCKGVISVIGVIWMVVSIRMQDNGDSILKMRMWCYCVWLSVQMVFY